MSCQASSRKRLAILPFLLVFAAQQARANGSDAEFFGLEFNGETGSQRTVALDTDVQVEITGLVARIDVTQVFQNNGPGWAEAVYRYPLPPGSAVDRMRVHAGGRILEGEIQEKEQARRLYQQAKSSGKTASLVEQQRVNQFETRLANIAPGDHISVSIGFLAQVDYRDGSFSLRIPMTFTPRWGDGGGEIAPLAFAAGSRSHGAGGHEYAKGTGDYEPWRPD